MLREMRKFSVEIRVAPVRRNKGERLSQRAGADEVCRFVLARLTVEFPLLFRGHIAEVNDFARKTVSQAVDKSFEYPLVRRRHNVAGCPHRRLEYRVEHLLHLVVVVKK